MFQPMKLQYESCVGSVSSNGENFLSPLLASHLTKIKPEQTKCFTVFELSGLSGCVPLSTGLIFKITKRAFDLEFQKMGQCLLL